MYRRILVPVELSDKDLRAVEAARALARANDEGDTEVALLHVIETPSFLENVPMIPRIISEHAHSKSGIDINPGAQIGERFFIDHGTGVVIGATAVIGGLMLAATISNLIIIPHPMWFNVTSIGAIALSAWFARSIAEKRAARSPLE